MRIVFAGTPSIAATVLEALLIKKFNIVAVYTQPDRPKGRGQQLIQSPVKILALSKEITVEQPISLRSAEAEQTLKSYSPDLMVVVAYGLLLPPTILSIPVRGCWNGHVSLLPRWRGAAPIQRAIEAGDLQTGVSIMQMEAGLDTGPILYQIPVPILPTETAQSLHDRLAGVCAEAFIKTLESGGVTPRPQPLEGVTYARKLTKEECPIDWNKSAVEIVNKIRAFNPTPVATTLWKGQVIRIWSAEVAPGSGQPGEILERNPQGIVVAAGHEAVRLLTLQLPAKTVQPVAALLNGYPDWLTCREFLG